MSLFFTIVRVFVYLWVGVELIALSNLYEGGYKYQKKTPIIKTLYQMFFVMGLIKFYIAFAPVLVLIDKEIAINYQPFLVLLMIPLGILVKKFRKQSVKQKSVKLPNNKENDK